MSVALSPDTLDRMVRAVEKVHERLLRAPALEVAQLAYAVVGGDIDRTHLRDLIDVGLVDESWYDRLDPTLTTRLRSLIETPGG
jgi:hypothetical protein